MIEVGATSDPVLNRLIQKHPRFIVQGDSTPGSVEFRMADWHRKVDLDVAGCEIAEIADNNPMVCADSWPVPDAATTLARIALDPLFRAEVVVESPVLIFSFAPPPQFVSGFAKDFDVAVEPLEMGSVVGITAIAEVEKQSNSRAFQEIFEESYQRSFFVHSESGAWSDQLVANSSRAVYNLRLNPGDMRDLLTVTVLADKDGKCGAGQVVHALNIMCGFEESLGLDTILRA